MTVPLYNYIARVITYSKFFLKFNLCFRSFRPPFPPPKKKRNSYSKSWHNTNISPTHFVIWYPANLVWNIHFNFQLSIHFHLIFMWKRAGKLVNFFSHQNLFLQYLLEKSHSILLPHHVWCIEEIRKPKEKEVNVRIWLWMCDVSAWSSVSTYVKILTFVVE